MVKRSVLPIPVWKGPPKDEKAAEDDPQHQRLLRRVRESLNRSRQALGVKQLNGTGGRADQPR